MDPVYHAFFTKLAEEVVTSRAELQKRLEPGDILVTSTAKSKSILDRAWDMASRSVQGDKTHASMYVGGGKVVEMINGIRHRPLEESLRRIEGVALRPNLHKAVRAAVAKKLVVRIQSEGDQLQYNSLPFVAKAVAERYATKRLFKDDTTEPGRYTCSGLIADAYKDKMRIVPNKGTGYAIPRDFLESPMLTPVVTYRNSKRHDIARRPTEGKL